MSDAENPPASKTTLDLGPLFDFAEGAATLRKVGLQRFVCVRKGDEVHALDDRCPHQGYPLSQGVVRDGVLTCAWHNWKFELGTGACTFGGEPVRRYKTEVLGGLVRLDPSIDRAGEAERLQKSLRASLLEGDPSRALREGLRLGEALGVSPKDELGVLRPAFAALAKDAARRAEYGFDHSLAMMPDVCSWVARGDITAEEGFVLLATAVADMSSHLPERPVPAGEVASAEELSRVANDLENERRSDAEARVRRLTREVGPERVIADALLPFASGQLYDYGHGLIYVAKVAELCARFPEVAEDLLAAITVRLGWATAETSLPPFSATRAALASIASAPPPPSRNTSFDRSAYETAVLASEREALASTRARLDEGASPRALLQAVAHAAAIRLARFDSAWEDRIDADVTVLDVSHAATFCEAALSLTREDPRFAPRLSLIAAGFVGKLRKADAPGGAPKPGAEGAPSLLDAARSRDVSVALRVAAGLDGEARRASYRALAPFLAFEVAVRPIFYAHAVKVGEALFRLDRDDEDSDGAYLEALLAYTVPRRREQRFARVATIATKFLADGRPPEGLY